MTLQVTRRAKYVIVKEKRVLRRHAQWRGIVGIKTWFFIRFGPGASRQEADPDSILHFYRKAIRLRKSLPVVRHGAYREHFRRSRQHYVYSREMPGEKLLLICSFADHDTALKLPAGFNLDKAELILTNYSASADCLRPYEARVYHWQD